MQLLPTLSRIEDGEIIFFNDEEKINIEKLERNGKKMREIRGSDIAMIFQDPMTALNPVYTVGFQIAENLQYHTKMNNKEIRKKTISLLNDMGIPLPEIRVDEYPHSYSGGMRQRAMIAMAMACNPKILIADEPTTALDVTIQAQIFELMAKLKKDYNTAIMLITHDMGVVAELADNVAIAKGIGGGFPIGAVLMNKKVASGMTAGTHGSTFGGNPLAMAVGNSVMDIISDKKFLNNVKSVSKYFFLNLNKIKSRYPKVIKEIRGKGLLIGIQLYTNQLDFIQKLMENKLLTIRAAENVVRILPPLNVKKSEVDQALKIIIKVCSELN